MGPTDLIDTAPTEASSDVQHGSVRCLVRRLPAGGSNWSVVEVGSRRGVYFVRESQASSVAPILDRAYRSVVLVNDDWPAAVGPGPSRTTGKVATQLARR